MTSREKILNAIKQAKPAEVELPSTTRFTHSYTDVVAKYVETLTGIGGKAFVIDGLDEIKALLTQKQDEHVEVVNGVAELGETNIADYILKTPAEVEQVNTVFIKGEIAVSENACVWISERSMGNRMLPFICQHLVMVVEANKIVGNMHDAYDKIAVDEDGYGVFIAGPSKTADIEQSLVIGAHGPLSLQVFILR